MYLNSKSLYSSFLFLSKSCIKEEEKPCGKLQMITKSWGNTLTQLFKTQARIITAWALWGGLVLVGGTGRMGVMGLFIVRSMQVEVPVMFVITWDGKQARWSLCISNENLQFMDIWYTPSLVRNQSLGGLFTCWRTWAAC